MPNRDTSKIHSQQTTTYPAMYQHENNTQTVLSKATAAGFNQA
uniref:Uncharacterized protein n=1 Tax=Anguilla anguilla TaxID=7936 RepID=A0A0E9WCI3_ANGAN